MADPINPTQPIAPSLPVISETDKEKQNKPSDQKQEQKKSSNDKANVESANHKGNFDEYA